MSSCPTITRWTKQNEYRMSTTMTSLWGVVRLTSHTGGIDDELSAHCCNHEDGEMIMVLYNWYWTTKSPFYFYMLYYWKPDTKGVDWLVLTLKHRRNKAKCGSPDKQFECQREKCVWRIHPGKTTTAQARDYKAQISEDRLMSLNSRPHVGTGWEKVRENSGYLNSVIMDQPSVKCIYESVTTYNVPMVKYQK